MSRKISLIRGSNQEILQMIQLNDPQNVDGTNGSVQSTAIDGKMVRIVATNGAIHFLIGSNPTALTTSHYLADQQEIYQPCNIGDLVAVLGGTANIATAGV
jgi:hypothetical protein